jgi:hypothetical protein
MQTFHLEYALLRAGPTDLGITNGKKQATGRRTKTNSAEVKLGFYLLQTLLPHELQLCPVTD